jgi:uncharacterized membrane protein
MKSVLSVFNFKIIFLLILFFTCSCQPDISEGKEPYIEARVLKILSSLTLQDKDQKIESQETRILVKILNGPDRNKELIVNQQLNPGNRNVAIPAPGETVILAETILPGGVAALQITDYRRSNTTWLAIILFVICLGIIGGLKGLIFFGFLALIFLITIFIIFPLIAFGISPVILTLMMATLISFMINFVIHNSIEKFRMIVLSNFISLFIVTLFAYFLARAGSFSTLLSRENIGISNYEIDAGAFIASSIIMAALGGIINVSVFTFDHASDVRKMMPKADLPTLIYSTIIYSRPSIFLNFLFIFLIYMGLALPILVTRYKIISVQSIINLDIISFYLICTTIGGLGIITSSIVSCLLSSYFLVNKKAKKTGKLSPTRDAKK